MTRGYTLIALVALAGCRKPDCLRGGDCEEAAICERVEFTCDGDPELFVGRVGELPGGLPLTRADGTADDLVLSNGQIVVVLDALGEPHDLAPTGGNILDFGPAGGNDDINLIGQIAGILPDDAFAYTDLEIIDESPDLVAVVVRGALNHRSDVEVATRYELRACDRGVRMRSELRNRTPDSQVFVVGDGAHWGKRRTLPFTPRPGEGFVQPALELIHFQDSWETFPYVAARAGNPEATGYGFVRCDADRLEGVNDPEISAVGTARTLVRPGERLVLERMLFAEGGSDLAPVVEVIQSARRQLHGDPGPTVVRGRALIGDAEGGDLRTHAVIIGDRSRGQFVPLTWVTQPGQFQVEVTAEAVSAEVWSFGRRVAMVDGAAGAAEVDLGDLMVPEPAVVTLSIAGPGGPVHGLVAFAPVDVEEAERLQGSFHGRYGVCAPWLGPPHGASPACNRVLVPPEGTELQVPAGHYFVYATAGLDLSLARQEVTVADGEVAALDFTLAALDLRPPGRLWADLHVHGRASFDSSIPDWDRTRSFVAAGVEVIAATDHDYSTDYAGQLTGLEDQVVVMGGLETTQLIPWMDVPGDDFPRVIGHFNFWPLASDPAEPRGGAPWDELVEAGELFDIMDPLVGADGLMMMNHPWDDTQFGRDLGYLRAINFDPRRPIPTEDNGTAQGMLVRRPGSNHRNVDFDVIEVINGATPINYMTTRPLWFSLLSQGYVKPGAANSDSHGLTDAQLGYARTLVDAPTTVADFDVAAFNGAIRDGKTLGVNGVLVLVTIGRTERTEPSLAPYVPVGEDWIDIEVRAPPWVPVTEVRLSTSAGTVVIAEGDDLSTPDDPFGTGGVVRIRRAIDLDEVLPGGRDDWIVIEAGIPLPASADLDDDGVPDTSDNNGDGEIDDADIEEGEDSGPLVAPPDPTDPDDPRFVCTQVIPGMWPSSFAGPILIDQAGDGWDPPGVSP